MLHEIGKWLIHRKVDFGRGSTWLFTSQMWLPAVATFLFGAKGAIYSIIMLILFGTCAGYAMVRFKVANEEDTYNSSFSKYMQNIDVIGKRLDDIEDKLDRILGDNEDGLNKIIGDKS
jgi:hypothetical protein